MSPQELRINNQLGEHSQAITLGHDAEETLDLILNAIPLTIFWKDRDLKIRGCNQQFCDDAGVSQPSEIIGKSDFDLPWTDQEAEFYRKCDRRIMDRDQAEIGIIEPQTSADGQQSWVETSKIPLHDTDGNVVGLLGVYNDVTEIKASEFALQQTNDLLARNKDELEARVLERTRELQHMAQHDGLTGLANRGHFVSRLNDELEGPNQDFALLFIDLDRFKTINDSLGHGAGDELLVQVSKILKSAVRPGDVVSRFGGDEFTILLSGIQDLEQATAVSDRIQRSLRHSITIGHCSLVVTASIGIVIENTEGYESAEDVLRDADIAMYEAKGNGKARHQVFSSDMLRKARERLELENEMRAGLLRDEFILHYQPVCDLKSNRLVGFEALVRWQHPTRGLMLPESFLNLAEETGLMADLGDAILRQASAQLQSFRKELGTIAESLSINVNLSPTQISRRGFADYLDRCIGEFGLNPHDVKIEIMENLLLQDDELFQGLFSDLRQRGYKLLLDDFGTGFCSLSYLHRFPIDTLKIDRSFVQSMLSDTNSEAIVKTILAMAALLDLNVVAEGVETQGQEQQLLKLGCIQVQGFRFARPLPADQAVNYIKACEQDGICRDFSKSDHQTRPHGQ